MPPAAPTKNMRIDLPSLSRSVVSGCLAVIPVVAAYDYGGILPWTKWLLSGLVILTLVVAAPATFQRLPISRSIFLIPSLAIGIWLFGFFQTLHLSPAAIAWLSPASAAAYDDWIPDAIKREAAEIEDAELKPTLSVSAWHTKTYLVIPALLAATTFLGIVAFRTDRDILIFFVITVVAGATFSFLGIADKINARDTTSGLIEPSTASAPFGPFVNRNNGAGYLNLCLACACGWLIYRHRTNAGRLKVDQRYGSTGEGVLGQIVDNFRIWLRTVDNMSIVVIAMAVIIASGIFVSGSRGGMLAAIAGTSLAAFRSFARSKKFSAFAGVSIGFVCVGILLGILGLIESVQERFASIFGDDNLETDGRLIHWQDSLSAALEYLPTGCGLGSYRFGYLPFQEIGMSSWCLNADGMPMEVFLEGGLVFVLLALGIIASLYWTLWKQASRKNTAASSAIATMAWFALPSILISQSFDFGILLPAMTLLAGAIFGATLSAGEMQVEASSKRKKSKSLLASGLEYPGTATSKKPEPVNPKKESEVPRFVIAGICWIGCIGTLAHSWGTQYEASETDRLTRQLDAWQYKQVDAFGEIETISDELAEAAQRYPNNSELLYCSCRAFLLKSRLRFDRFSENQTEDAFEKLWQVSSPGFIRYRYYQNGYKSWQKALLPGQLADDYARARENAVRALLLSPLDDRIRTILLQLDFLKDSEETSTELLTQVQQLRTRSPRLLEQAAVLAAVHPGGELAVSIWKNVIDLSPNQLQSVWKSIEDFQLDTDVTGLVPDDPQSLLFAAAKVKRNPDELNSILERLDIAIQKRLGRKIDQYGEPLDDGNWSYFSAKLAIYREDLKAAERHYRDAVQVRQEKTDWRVEYVKLLIETGNSKEAREQVDRCMLQRPDDMGLHNLAKKISDMPSN